MFIIDSEKEISKQIQEQIKIYISQGLAVSYPWFLGIPVYIATVYLSM